jgi:hypothetical protein
MPAVTTISPGEVMNFNSRSSAARQNLLSSKAAGEYQRQLQRIQFGDRVGDFERQANRGRMQLPTSFISRGVCNSGLYKNALSQYAVDRSSALKGLHTNFQLGQQDSIFNDRSSEDAFAAQMAQINAERYARQAQLAAMLREAM